MLAALHLALRYVLRHRLQSLLLAAALGLVVALPLCLRVLVRHAQTELRSRAASTPQIIGTRGSALDLMMTALYFKKEKLASMKLKNVAEGGIPLHVRFEAQGAPIVGTTLEYFGFRRLHVEMGEQITRLGDCVVGARLARERGLRPGDAVFSTPEQTFDMAGTYPLKMRVRGILKPNNTPDDDAVFCDLKTAWLIEGRAHGHSDVKGSDVLKKEEQNTVANAAVRMFQEVTEANLNSFHFHGDTSDYPVSAAIMVPPDAKTEALMAGDYARSKTTQLIRPRDDMEALLKQLVRLEGFASTMLLATASAALFISALVFALSFRLRKQEFNTLEDIGVSRLSVIKVKALEIILIALVAAIIASSLYAATLSAAPLVMRMAM
jgi:putative ABC transport system permease protein